MFWDPTKPFIGFEAPLWARELFYVEPIFFATQRSAGGVADRTERVYLWYARSVDYA